MIKPFFPKEKMVTSDFFDQNIDDVSFKNEKNAIGETPESRIRGIEYLRNKLLKIKDLNPRLEDEFLLRFLRTAKFDEKKAYERIHKYYSVKKKYNHVFKDFYPTAAKAAMIKSRLLACPHRTTDNGVVVIIKRGMQDTTKVSYEEFFLMDSLAIEFLSENPFTQVCGVHIILDFSGYGFQQFIQDTPGRVRMVADTMQNSFPIRYKTIHIVNAPQLFSIFYNICYPFLTTKIRKRLIVHNDNDWKSLHSIIPAESLPLEYGGTIPKTDLIDITEELIKKDAQFKEQLQYGFDKKT